MANSNLKINCLDDLQLLPSSGTDQLPGKIRKIRVHTSGKFSAVCFTEHDSLIYLFGEQVGNACEILEILEVGSTCDFAFSPSNFLLAVVSARGDAFVYDLVQFPATKSTIQLHRFICPNFSRLEFSKDGSLIAIASDTELIVVEKKDKWRQTKPALGIGISTNETKDFITDVSIHPEKCAIAVASTAQRAVLILGIPGYGQKIQESLRTRPVEEEGGPLGSPTGHGTAHLNPNVLNLIPLAASRGVPVACVWSPYGETLAVATSDNFLTLWNVSTSCMETFALDEGTVVREIFFFSDSLLVISTSDDAKIICVNVDDGVMFETSTLSKRSNKTLCGGSLSGGIVYKAGKKNHLISRFKLTV